MGDIKHGTTTGYYGQNCRCADCRAAGTAYVREYRRNGPRKPCAVEICTRLVPRGQRLCSAHYKRQAAGLSVDDYLPRGTGDDVGYEAAHRRLRRAKGSARQYACTHCAERQALQWAFIHGSPGEKPAGVQRNGRPHGPYSLNPDEYMPLCASCHKLYDNAHRRRVAC